MPQIRKYSLKGRIMRGNTVIGYTVQNPNGVRQDIDAISACNLARQGMINHVRATADNRLVGNGIKISSLPSKQG